LLEGGADASGYGRHSCTRGQHQWQHCPAAAVVCAGHRVVTQSVCGAGPGGHRESLRAEWAGWCPAGAWRAVAKLLGPRRAGDHGDARARATRDRAHEYRGAQYRQGGTVTDQEMACSGVTTGMGAGVRQVDGEVTSSSYERDSAAGSAIVALSS